MSYDGLPARADLGVRVARADRRASSSRSSTLRRGASILGATATALVFAACNSNAAGSGAVSSGGATTSTAPSAAASPSASAAAGRLATSFQPANGSSVFGGAVLSDLSDGTTAVTIGIVAIGFQDPMPAVLEQGACADLTSGAGASGSPAASADASGGAGASAGASGGAGSVASASPAASTAPAGSGGASASGGAGASGAPSASASSGIPGPVSGPPFQLAPVNAGSSNTVIQTTTSALLATPFAIAVSKSAADPTIVACSDVTNVPIPSSLPSSLPSGLPSLLPSALPSLAASGSTAP
jgi:hypothetical protein